MAAATGASSPSFEPQQQGIEDGAHDRRGASPIQHLRRHLVKWRMGTSDAKAQAKTDIRGPLGLNLLHEPPQPRFDFVFVHGLLGGSKKTWSYSPEPDMYWPKDWLPNEVGFEHVRVHSYGYNSDWTTAKESHLSIHDFGQAFLADLYNSPHLRRTPETPVVLIAHSMGGLVAKKAYLLALDDSRYEATARRIQAIYFLGTPHRGSALARIAKLVCQKGVYWPKVFVEELVPGSQSLDHINDDFRSRCGDLGLWSFFEGVETGSGPLSMLVVDKDSAVIGSPGERVQYLEADHRHVCKFDSRTDPNYLILQRCLLTTLEELNAKKTKGTPDTYDSDMALVSSLLRVGRDEDTILATIQQKHQPGSCQWLSSNETLQDWLSYPELACSGSESLADRPPNILWLSGRPGTGKSVTAAHLVTLLGHRQLEHGFYFFHHNDGDGSTVCSLLRSLAVQMAKCSLDTRKALVSMVENEVVVNLDDHNSLWKKVFADRILKIEREVPYFWVIDAVDECAAEEITALVSILSRLSGKPSVKVFFTGRPGSQLGKCLSRANIRYLDMSIAQDETMKDIELYLTARCSPTADGRFYPGLVPEILSSCRGIFLWASLIVAELEEAYTVEDMRAILRNMPAEMNGFYTRILASIAASPNWEIAQCVLRWAVCAPRPLTMEEVLHAVKLDIGRTLTATSSQLQAITGHLISVDQQAQVHIIHETAAGFLTQKQSGGAPWIDRTVAHSSLAKICLSLLCGPEFRPPRTYRGASSRGIAAECVLSDYAGTHFSYHLIHGSRADHAAWGSLDTFLTSTVLTWIERVARTGDLSPVRRSLNRLGAYIQEARAESQPQDVGPLRLNAQIVDDIRHFSDAFHSCLLDSPSSAHFLIPHLCPRSSAIRRLFARDTKRLEITTTLNTGTWTDRSTCHFLPRDAVSIACSDRFLAVGLCRGSVEVFKMTPYGVSGRAGTLRHWFKTPKLLLAFGASSTILATSSCRMLRVWNLGDLQDTFESQFVFLWSLDLDFEPINMSFSHDGRLIMLANATDSSVVIVDAVSGQRHARLELVDPSYSDSATQFSDGTPMAGFIGLDKSCKLAAVGSGRSRVHIWELEASEIVGTLDREEDSGESEPSPILDLVFAAAQSPEHLAVTYQDGKLVVLDIWTMATTGMCNALSPITVLASSSDGRFLVGGDQAGSIHLFDFISLARLYRMDRPDKVTSITDLTFSADNTLLLDVRGQCCSVWRPPALERESGACGGYARLQDGGETPPETPECEDRVCDSESSITATQSSLDGDYLFLGRQDGTVDIYQASTGRIVHHLRPDGPTAEICAIDWNHDSNLLATADLSGQCIVRHVPLVEKQTARQVCRLPDCNGPDAEPAVQVLLSPCSAFMLVRTGCVVRLMTAISGSCISERSVVPLTSWMNHPCDRALILSIQERHAHVYRWSTLELVFIDGRLPILGHEIGDTLWMSRPGSKYIVRLLSSAPGTGTWFTSVDMAVVSPDSPDNPLQLRHVGLNTECGAGILGSRFYFLDSGGWVCSISLQHMTTETRYSRHFFVPPTWRTGEIIAMCIMSKSTVALVTSAHLMVFRGFLDFAEDMVFEEGHIHPLRRP